MNMNAVCMNSRLIIYEEVFMKSISKIVKRLLLLFGIFVLEQIATIPSFFAADEAKTMTWCSHARVIDLRTDFSCPVNYNSRGAFFYMIWDIHQNLPQSLSRCNQGRSYTELAVEYSLRRFNPQLGQIVHSPRSDGEKWTQADVNALQKENAKLAKNLRF